MIWGGADVITILKEVKYMINVHEENKVAQSCPTLCNPMDCSLLGSSIHRIFQARVLEWVAISFCRGSSWPRDQARVFCIVGRCFPAGAPREVLMHMSHPQTIPSPLQAVDFHETSPWCPKGWGLPVSQQRQGLKTWIVTISSSIVPSHISQSGCPMKASWLVPRVVPLTS